jgi:hypothetical protein
LARDQKKKQTCNEAGITLIHIPYWYGKEGGGRRKEAGAGKREIGVRKQELGAGRWDRKKKAGAGKREIGRRERQQLGGRRWTKRYFS